jgi:hypothetical protein
VAEPPPRPNGVASHPLWGGLATPYGVVRPPQHISSSFFFFFFLKNKNKICNGGILGKKNAKVVELSQFEIFGGLSVTFETLEVKCK